MLELNYSYIVWEPLQGYYEKQLAFCIAGFEKDIRDINWAPKWFCNQLSDIVTPLPENEIYLCPIEEIYELTYRIKIIETPTNNK